jgi:hypothetical protein
VLNPTATAALMYTSAESGALRTHPGQAAQAQNPHFLA